MASTAIPTRLPSPVEIAHAAAAAIPSDISTRPLLGILGVIIGAGLVTLTGRMLSLGLADLKGHVGIGYDDGAWLDSAFNGALMFIGPFTVYLGGLLGPRRVLLSAAGVFAATCAFLPLIHSYSLLVAALIVAGLTSGTFYPLTLTFALRNIPLRFLPFTIALYATSVDGAVNIAPSLYGWYRDHLSWHWMFWNSALIAPVMMICVYVGIPAAPARKKDAPVPSFVGFLYLSAGLALFVLIQIFLRHFVDVRVRAARRTLAHATAHFEVSVRIVGIGDRHGHAAVTLQVLVLLPPHRGVEENPFAVVVDPYRRHLRFSAGHQRR